jgi:hypothetical protein
MSTVDGERGHQVTTAVAPQARGAEPPVSTRATRTLCSASCSNGAVLATTRSTEPGSAEVVPDPALSRRQSQDAHTVA